MAVIGAVAVSLLVLCAGFLLFNNSATAKNRREQSKQLYEERKKRSAAGIDEGAASEGVLTDESIDQEAGQIDESLQSIDQGQSSIQADELTDSGLGIN